MIEAILPLLIQIGLPVLLLAMGIGLGRRHERKHLADLANRESQLSVIRVNNLKRIANPEQVQRTFFVTAQVVIATDYFKTFATTLKKLVGGELKSAQTLLLRARREALARILEQGERLGADELYNVRFSFSNINQMQQGKNKGAMQAEMLVCATAVVRQGHPTIRTDVPCPKCRYNLRGCNVAQPCPECGDDGSRSF